jgi:methyl-accepting chemotaxis protein
MGRMVRRVALWFVVIAVALAAAIAGGIAAKAHLQEMALADAFARLRLFHELRRAALEDYLKSMASDVRAASENARVIDAAERLAFAWSTMGPDARKVLSRQYIAENPHPEGERYKLEAVEDNSYYARDHRAFHDWAKRFREHFGYYDLFLISPAGDIIYTVAKESDFATNLKTGPYRKSPLADVFRRAVANPTEAVTISDFAHYPPSGNAAAAFAGHAIEKDGKVIGVFAVQIPAEPLNDLMRLTAGMGDTGETYLVGPDGLMRSQSRFSDAPTLLETKVDNQSVREGRSGKSGAHIVADYRGIPVLSVYAPVDFGGQPFILLAEIDKAEVLGEAKPVIVVAAAVLSGLVAGLLVLLLYWLMRPSRRRPTLEPAR